MVGSNTQCRPGSNLKTLKPVKPLRLYTNVDKRASHCLFTFVFKPAFRILPGDVLPRHRYYRL